MSYEQRLKRKWDWESALSTARRDGLEQGREQGREEGHAEGRVTERRKLATQLKQKGISRNPSRLEK